VLVIGFKRNCISKDS